MTEDNKQKWLALFDAMKRLSELEPWKHFDETPCIIYDREDGKKILLNILGASYDKKGFMLHIGEENFSLPIFCAAENKKLAQFIQNCIFMVWADRSEVSKQNYALIKELGLNFKGRGGWLTITAFRERCVPSLPDIADVDELTEIYETYCDIIKSAVFSSKVYEISKAKAIYAKRNKDNKWKCEIKDYEPVLPEAKLDFDDTEKLNALKTKIPSQKPVFVEEFCNSRERTDNDTGIKYYPLLISFLDPDTADLIYEEEFTYNTSRERAFATTIANYTERYGKPRQIIADNNFTAYAAEPICKNQGIALAVAYSKDGRIFDPILSKLLRDLEIEAEQEKEYLKKKRPTKKSNTIYTISVSLGTGCYRHIKISGDDTLDNLHEAILDSFGFDNDHLYAFFMDNKAWSRADAYYSPYNESGRLTDKYNISEVMEEKHKFVYLFDFGDCWKFKCKVLKIQDGICKNPEIVRSKGEAPPQYPNYDDNNFDDEW